ncbi:MAG: hypothetical protein V3W04_03240 [Gammaproteobacteria bacterium]
MNNDPGSQQWARPTIPIYRRLLEHTLLVENTDMNRKIMQQFETIKKPVIANACGDTASLVDNGHLIVVTSTRKDEGKTYISLNLALAIAAEQEQSVILIDGDILDRGMTRLLNLEGFPGFIDIIESSETTIQGALIKSDIPELYILPVGSMTERGIQALCSLNMDKFLTDLSHLFQDSIIIIDTPAVLTFTGTQVFTEIAGQIVFVIEANATTEKSIHAALELLPPGAPVNLVLNKSRSLSRQR